MKYNAKQLQSFHGLWAGAGQFTYRIQGNWYIQLRFCDLFYVTARLKLIKN